MAVWVPLKGADEYAVKRIRAFIQTLGFPSSVLQRDSEHSALAVSKVAVEPISGWSTRQTPLNSTGSNVMVERLHWELQGMFRTIRSCVEEQYKMRLPTYHPLLPWLFRVFRHTSWLRDRFLVDQRDQRTAYQRHHQRLYQRPLVQFGECVLWKDPHKQGFKYEANWGYGVYLGTSMESEEHLIAARPAGVVKCRSVRRCPIAD
eukprot:3095162-Amphidinium_carterae.2